MTTLIPLLAPYTPGQAFGWHGGRIVHQGDIVAQATRLALRIDGEQHVFNLCDDRILFIIGYAAALIAGATSLLPPNRAPHALRELYGRYREPLCLADHDSVPDGLRTLRVDLDEATARTRASLPRIPAAQPAAVLFTSGSTGKPRPATKSWGALTAGARSLCDAVGIETGGDIVVAGTVPPQHMFGLESTVVLPLQAGLMVNANRPLLPADIAATLTGMPGGKWLMTTPMQLRACVEAGVALPHVRGVISSTMPLPESLARAAEALCGAPVHEIYGCSEAGMVATRRTVRGPDWQLARGVRAWQEKGITWIRGGHVEEAVRLEDRITLNDDDRFTLSGRLADMVKIAGKRTSLPALDAELVSIDGVVDGAFFVPEHDNRSSGRRLTAFVVTPGLSTGEVLAALRQRIDPAFLPRPLHRVEALPRNGNGKLPREALQQLFERLGTRSVCGAPE